MATNFKVWVDDASVGAKVESATEFANESQRTAGFTPNTAASSKIMNSALRQANLVACAWMELLLPNNTTLSLTSSVNAVMNAMVEAVPWKQTTGDIKDGKVGTGAIKASAVTTSRIADNAVTNDKLAGDIDKGKIEVGIIDDYDTTKGTIEERLTALGFRSGTVSILGETYGNAAYTDTNNDGLYRQGNCIFCKIYTGRTFTKNQIDVNFAQGSTLFTLNSQFRPKKQTSVTFSVYAYYANAYYDYLVEAHIGTDGKCIIDKCRSISNSQGPLSAKININFGFEASPIQA